MLKFLKKDNIEIYFYVERTATFLGTREQTIYFVILLIVLVANSHKEIIFFIL